MNLSDSLYNEICGALGLTKAPAEPTNKDKRRRIARYPVKVEIQVEPLAVVGSKTWKVQVSDFSTAGFGFVDQIPHGCNDRIIVHFPRTNGRTVPLIAVIRNARLVSGKFRVGAQFISRAEFTREGWTDDSTGLPEEFPSPTGTAEPHGRSVARLPVCSSAVMYLYRGDEAGPVLEAKLVDCSVNGVGLTCSSRLENDTRFMLWVEEKNRKPFGRFCSVTNCRQIAPGRYRIGAKFIGKKPPVVKKEKLLTRLFRRGSDDRPLEME